MFGNTNNIVCKINLLNNQIVTFRMILNLLKSLVIQTKYLLLLSGSNKATI